MIRTYTFALEDDRFQWQRIWNDAGVDAFDEDPDRGLAILELFARHEQESFVVRANTDDTFGGEIDVDLTRLKHFFEDMRDEGRI